MSRFGYFFALSFLFLLFNFSSANPYGLPKIERAKIGAHALEFETSNELDYHRHIRVPIEPPSQLYGEVAVSEDFLSNVDLNSINDTLKAMETLLENALSRYRDTRGATIIKICLGVIRFCNKIIDVLEGVKDCSQTFWQIGRNMFKFILNPKSWLINSFAKVFRSDSVTRFGRNTGDTNNTIAETADENGEDSKLLAIMESETDKLMEQIQRLAKSMEEQEEMIKKAADSSEKSLEYSEPPKTNDNNNECLMKKLIGTVNGKFKNIQDMIGTVNNLLLNLLRIFKYPKIVQAINDVTIGKECTDKDNVVETTTTEKPCDLEELSLKTDNEKEQPLQSKFVLKDELSDSSKECSKDESLTESDESDADSFKTSATFESIDLTDDFPSNLFDDIMKNLKDSSESNSSSFNPMEMILNFFKLFTNKEVDTNKIVIDIIAKLKNEFKSFMKDSFPRMKNEIKGFIQEVIKKYFKCCSGMKSAPGKSKQDNKRKESFIIHGDISLPSTSHANNNSPYKIDLLGSVRPHGSSKFGISSSNKHKDLSNKATAHRNENYKHHQTSDIGFSSHAKFGSSQSKPKTSVSVKSKTESKVGKNHRKFERAQKRSFSSAEAKSQLNETVTNVKSIIDMLLHLIDEKDILNASMNFTNESKPEQNNTRTDILNSKLDDKISFSTFESDPIEFSDFAEKDESSIVFTKIIDKNDTVKDEISQSLKDPILKLDSNITETT